MALLTAKQISSAAIALLVRQFVLGQTVVRVPAGEFAGSNGDTITIRVPQPGSSRTQATRSADITYDDISEVGVDVTVSHLYHGKLVSDEELTLDLVDFGAQVLSTQVAAVGTGAEDELAGAMNDLSADDSFASSFSESDTEENVLAAREALTANDVPAADRWAAVSPEIATRVLQVDKFSRVDASGMSQALRDAVIGRLYGFTFVESNALDSGTAVFYHRSGFGLGNPVPAAPRGATSSATAEMGGFGLRHILQYVPDKLSDASVVSTFAGASVVDSDRVYKLDTAAA